MTRPFCMFLIAIALSLQPRTTWAEEGPDLRAEVQRLIEQLDDDSFAAREAAERRLFEIGGPVVIIPLVAAADDRRLEVTNRATALLLRLYRSSGQTTRDKIDDFLDQLAASERASSARRAKAAVGSLSELRHKRALVRLRELKAIIPRKVPGFDQVGNGDSSSVQVWLDNQWQGDVEGLRWLKRLKKIRALYFVEGCPVPEEDVLELERNMTGLGVQTRGEACLGLSTSQAFDERGVVVGRVSEGGSIEAAGLRPGDIITTYEGEKMETFDELVERIRKNKTGSTVTVEYLRGGMAKTAQVKLKSWREVFDDQEKQRPTRTDGKRKRNSPSTK